MQANYQESGIQISRNRSCSLLRLAMGDERALSILSRLAQEGCSAGASWRGIRKADQMLGRIKQTGKRIINAALPVSFLYRQGEKPNILLFASRRGGSTYLAGLIGCESGMRLVDEPFNLTDFDIRRNRAKEAHLPRMPLSQFITLSDSEAEKVRRYMLLLLNGGLSELNSYRPPKNRTTVKILNAAPLVDWFAEHFEVLTIYLVRHPIPQALSVMRNNWTITAEAYLKNPVFSGKYLSVPQRRTGMRIMEKGTHLEKLVLNWVLENLYPLKYANRIDLTLTYEELALFPTMAIDLVAEAVGLENVRGMYRRVNTPSSSRQFSESETNEAIKKKDRGFLVSKWMSKVGKTTREEIGEILDAFDIYEYSSEGPLPSERLCHFRCHASDPEVWSDALKCVDYGRAKNGPYYGTLLES